MPWGDYSLEFAWFEDPPDPTSWVEAGERCFTASFARGRDSQLDQINPLAGSLLMNNSDRHFSFDYAPGPYSGYLLPKRVGRLGCEYGALATIGAAASDRTTRITSLITVINTANPVAHQGRITSVSLWAETTLAGNVEVATFYLTGANQFSTRDRQAIGPVVAGSRQTFAVDLECEEGDYIGAWLGGAGYLECDTVGGAGIWAVAGDQVPCTDVVFGVSAGYAISLQADGIVVYPLSRFMVSEITPDDRYDVQQATIRIFDALTWLEQIVATHTYTDVTTGELIAEALDEAGWPADLRQLDAGQLAGINVTYTDAPIWSGHILKGLESERGIAFIGRDGAVVYQDRHHRYKGAHLTPQVIFVDGMRDFRPSLSYREIANDVVVTYAGGGTVQRIDASSQDAYGPMRLPVTAELLGLGDATSLAEWLLDRRKDPHSKPPRLLITNGTEAKYQALLDLEISDRVRVTDSRSGIATVDFYIEGIQHDIDFRQHTHQAEYTLTLCDVDRYLLIGVPGYAEFGSGKFGY